MNNSSETERTVVEASRSLLLDGCSSTSKYATKRFNRLQEPLARRGILNEYLADVKKCHDPTNSILTASHKQS